MFDPMWVGDTVNELSLEGLLRALQKWEVGPSQSDSCTLVPDIHQSHVVLVGGAFCLGAQPGDVGAEHRDDCVGESAQVGSVWDTSIECLQRPAHILPISFILSSTVDSGEMGSYGLAIAVCELFYCTAEAAFHPEHTDDCCVSNWVGVFVPRQLTSLTHPW